jgi:nitroreductase
MHKVIESSLNWRYAVKRFDADKKISEADWNTLVSSLVMAPSSFGLQPWKFVVVQNPALRLKLKEASWNQGQVTDASHFVVFATSNVVKSEDVQKYISSIATTRGISAESLDGLKAAISGTVKAHQESGQLLNWTQRQAYIAMGFLLETAALLKVDATPMEGLDPAQYDKILSLEGSGFKTVAAVALGYRHSEDTFQNLKKVRFAASEVVQYL